MARRPAPSRHPDRRSLQELVEDLREEAVDLAPHMNGTPPHETTYGEAAQAVEELAAALTQIADGAPDPAGIAREALALGKPLEPIPSDEDDDDDADDSIRKLLKPRSA